MGWSPGDSGDHSSGDWIPHRRCDRSSLRAGEVFPPPGRLARALDHARTFAGKNEDFTLAKRTALYNERVYLDFRAEFFNLFNRHIYDAPNGFATPLGSPFQPVGAPGCPGPFACGFGAVTSASGPRTVQFGLKITY